MNLAKLKAIPAALVFFAIAVDPFVSKAAQITLNWSDNSSNEGGFSIERRTNTAPYAVIANTNTNITSYTDSSLVGGTTYCYRVRAFNASSYSAYTNEVCATTRATLIINRLGTGTVTSTPSGINCGSSCSATYNPGTAVTLTPSPGPGYVFSGWSGGGCAGTGVCMLSVNSDTSVTASFSLSSSSFVSSITPNAIDLASPPTSFNITGNGFANSGFGLSVVNFIRNGTVLAAVRASAGTSTSLTIPFPTNQNLSAGATTVAVYNQLGTNSWSLAGTTSLTVNDTRPPPSVSVATPNSIDLATPPTSLTISGNRFSNFGFGLSVINVTRNGTILAAARATSGTSTNLTTLLPSTNSGAYPGLSRGPATLEVYNQTGTNNWSLVGTTSFTINDSRPAPTVSAMTPNSIDLATAPTSFTITGTRFENSGFGLPVANFTRNGTILAAARASAGTSTSLTIPFPTTNGGSYPGLSAGPVTVQVWNQIGPNNWSFVGSTTLNVSDSRPRPAVNSITPSSINLGSPPASFNVTGTRFENSGFGLPVANFTRNGTILAAARASAGTSTSLTIPFPTANGGYSGLSAGPVTVQIWNQTGPNNWSFVGSASLNVQ